ncbi:hypothetical protein DdX_08509 [Ditylenchus destructor]|uniref:Uncharacterized protein n=1 Tax=Ditylenchus destructor TaxID=166010 RepID=A0AAD4N688_9BILA|nr:hypothetical protein DdX_08509 [Ditylenchus destructor]
MPKLPTQGVKNNGTKSDVIGPEQAKKIVNAIQDEFRKMDADTLNDLVKLVDNLDNAFLKHLNITPMARFLYRITFTA